MIKIYLIAHGFMHETKEITLTKKIITYVKDGEMYDGPNTKPLIDEESYPIDKEYKEVKNHEIGSVIKEHFISSEGGIFGDINISKYWKNKERSGLGTGTLFKFTDTIYVYASNYKDAIRLSDLIKVLETRFVDEEFEVHWTACRSFIKGDTDETLKEKMSSGDSVIVNGIVTS